MDVNYLQVEEMIKANYRLATAQYRRDDEIEVRTPNHRRLARRLSNICLCFPHPIRVLDVGCGTGRYFHCLKNVDRLTGLDVSEDMLTAARYPVFEKAITAREIQLLKCNAFLTSFEPESFDFIYSLGMFGHGCPVNLNILSRFHDWLAPGGALLFNTVDYTGLPWCHRARRLVRGILLPWLPRSVQQKLATREQRSPFFALSQSELKSLLAASLFSNFEVASYACASPLWNGRHLECLARKAPKHLACSQSGLH